LTKAVALLVAAAAPEETEEAAWEGANGDAAVAKSAKSIWSSQYCGCGRSFGGVEASITGIAGNSRRNGRSASEEAFEKIGHDVGAVW